MPHIIPVFINHAGCPHRCAFCNQRAINRRAGFSLPAVRAQIAEGLKWRPGGEGKEIAFYGGSFTGLPEETQENLLGIAQNLRREGKIDTIRLSTRPDYIDKKVVRRLLAHEVDLVEIGAQSLDDRVLALARRGHDAQSVMDAARLLRAAGLKTGLQLMVGLPGQTWRSIAETVEKVIEIKPDTVRIYPLLILAGTEFAAAWAKGCLEAMELETAVEEAAYITDKVTGHGIKVIRTGLQDDAGLREQGAILAGPYHPAFGELVAARRCRKAMETILAGRGGKGEAVFNVPARYLSQALGHKKSNMAYFKQHYPQIAVTFEKTECENIQLKEFHRE
ncbi:MAG: radical SAM protein [Acidaminococcales bacterium]|jgi:histone acetyltransferase (RNA polymerase elongator complex component)|nr:radical SAM protein [Acidaminococcales bacterium]